MTDKISRDHFDDIAEKYAGSERTLKPLYDAVREELNAAVAGRAVLDVGNGGIFPYDTSRAASVAVLDISPEMLKRVPSDGIRKIVADARDMAPCADSEFDIVIFCLSLHHIAAETAGDTQAGLRRALASALRVLRPGGELIVYEPTLGRGLGALQRALFLPVKAALKFFGVPMVYIQSRASLAGLMAEAFGVAENAVTATRPIIYGSVDPLGGTFPGLIRLPIALFPTTFVLFRLSKPRG